MNKPSLLARSPFPGIAIPLIVAMTYWYSNLNRLPYEDALPTIGFVLLLAVAVTAVLRLFAGSWSRAGLMSAIIAVPLFYLPQLVRALTGPGWGRWALVAVIAAVTTDLARRVPKKPEQLFRINRSMNFVFLTVVVLVGGALTVKSLYLEMNRPSPREVFSAFDGKASAESPDVWHFIFDRYAGNDTLKRVYRFDNKPFLDALKARGFAVHEHAFSNYQRTGHSVSSTMNGAYLNRLAEAMRGKENDWVPIYRAMTDNAALRFFDSQGYKTAFAGSWWNPTRRSLVADGNVNFRDLPELARLILDRSLIGAALAGTNLPYANARAEQCRRAHVKFEELGKLASSSERKYIFAHFLVPHPPFVINADGTCRTLEQATASSRRDNYVGQIRFVNAQILKLIDRILAGPRPAIIILHADEGPWPLPYVGDERFLGSDPVKVDWPHLSQGQLHEKMGILLAVRAPDGDSARDLPQSPVNIYPTLLRHHFGGTRSNAPDRHYLFEADNALYTFHDVTDRLKMPLVTRSSS